MHASGGPAPACQAFKNAFDFEETKSSQWLGPQAQECLNFSDLKGTVTYYTVH